MASPQHNAPVSVCAAEIMAQLGEELAFVEVVRDTGLLPINSLVMDFEEPPPARNLGTVRSVRIRVRFPGKTPLL